MPRSKSQARIKGKRNIKRKQDSGHGGTNKVWVRTRHRIRRKLLDR